MLNTNENSEEYADFSNAQVEWLKSDVKAAKAAGAQWIIIKDTGLLKIMLIGPFYN
ncbi:hypothetical protein [Paenibacillus rhizophilus]|uniref:hypothetical protein n=1 Tax=Paenibacillus rhizophilus TaxID=1850366 RepID=UPI00163A5346|nr:hypothetical protein [Paenibacillus rhizophilus]